MATLTFYKDHQELIRYVLRQETTSVGRGSSSDICLPDTNISRTHFVITMSNGKFLLSDKSTNGTLMGGQPVVTHELKQGDRIKAGDWEILFSQESGQEQETRVVAASESRDPTEVLSYEPESLKLKFRRAYLQSKDIKPGLFPITKEIVAIGKSKTNDICIANDGFVSNFHCKIENRRGRFFLKDLKSTNGTLLNKQSVIDVSIPPDSIITVGKTELKFMLLEEEEKIKSPAVEAYHGMVGSSTSMRRLYGLIERIAPSDVTVLLQGESGVGKELVARAIHQLSGRASKKLVILNCAAIAKELIESELFGHEKGAFTSAHQQRKGAFEEAQGGTLFLDEIGEMPLELQPKLLRVLENREIKRIGSNVLIDIDVRVVAATNRNLAEQVKKGQFREDLFYRLYVVPVAIPPLRERVDDIPLLAEGFLIEARGKQKTPKGFSAKAMESLMSFAWPGNVRELKNVISRAVLNVRGDKIEEEDLSFAPQVLREKTKFDPKDENPFQQSPVTKNLKDYEREMILQALMRNQWNKKKTADQLGIAKTTLFEKIKKYQLKP
jgi:DNA-binding NtrC family response regulator